MNQSSTSNSTDNNEFSLNSEENDYKNLIKRLKEISSKITLLEKKYFGKF